MDILTDARAAPPQLTRPDADGAHPVALRRRRWRVVAWVQLIVLAIIGVGVLFLPAPFLLKHPGLVIDASRHVSGPAVSDPVAGDGGHFLLTTERTTQLTWGGYAWVSASMPVGARVVPLPDSAPRSHYVSLAAMDQSKDVAAAVAGCAVHGCTPEPVGVRVVGVTSGSPAARGGLRAGDVIVAAMRFPPPRAYADDAEVPPLTTVPAILRIVHFAVTAAPTTGQRSVRLDVVRGATVETLSVTSDGGALGADLVTAWVAQRSLDVDTGRVGGPSTGLMLTLTMIDAMTEGDLAGGRRVAGTGTIAADGEVGPIGGVAAKVAGAARAGADAFVVPPVNAAQARRAAPSGLRVVESRTLDDALRWLCNTGGSAPVCASEGPPLQRQWAEDPGPGPMM